MAISERISPHAGAEITTVAGERAALPQSRLRLDAVRFVVSADFLALR
ncbi:MAG: hypothetical protein ACREPQ_09445 [Rhodanobacter sp.]